MTLEKGKPWVPDYGSNYRLDYLSSIHNRPTWLKSNIFCSYYLEILHQEYSGAASINIALFNPESSFTEDQTDDAVNEVQHIVAKYDVFDEEQVCGCLPAANL